VPSLAGSTASCPRSEYARTQQSIGAAILNLATDARAAWYSYISAQQVATMRSAVAAAAQTSAELAAKFF